MSTSAQDVVQFEHVSYQRQARNIFSDLSLSIKQFQITAIMGPSGSGKTTLLRLAGKQLLPNSGKITVFGRALDSYKGDQLLQLRRRMGVLFQSGALFSELNVFDNVALPLHIHTQLSARMIRDLVLIKLQMVGLRGARDLMPSELSGGMARRVALARAIILDPEIIFYDEPFTGQDPISAGVLVHLIKELNDALGMTSVIVSHDIEETTSISDMIYVIAEGTVIGHGEPGVLKQSSNPFIDQFVHGRADGPIAFHYPAHSSYAADLELNELEPNELEPKGTE